ncbi:MarR family transcriptional regulator [Fimbriiglobus ruber]|nr:helix-turn-helix domain-containing protein [Fimbriiglobus ruber]
MYEVGNSLRLDQGRTLPKIKKRLLDAELITAGEGRQLIALPPPIPEWWVSIKEAKKTGWQNNLAYVQIAHTPIGWTLQQTAIYFTLLSHAKGYKISRNNTQAGLGAILHVDRATVARTENKLIALGLIECDYLRRPSDEVLKMFDAKPKAKEKQWDVIIACGWPFGEMDGGPYLDEYVTHFTKQMLENNFSRDEVLKYWSHLWELAGKTPRKLLDFLMLALSPMLRDCLEDTRRNSTRGHFRGSNCLGMLLNRTSDKFAKPKPAEQSVERPKPPQSPSTERRFRPATDAPPGMDIEYECPRFSFDV